MKRDLKPKLQKDRLTKIVGLKMTEDMYNKLKARTEDVQYVIRQLIANYLGIK